MQNAYSVKVHLAATDPQTLLTPKTPVTISATGTYYTTPFTFGPSSEGGFTYKTTGIICSSMSLQIAVVPNPTLSNDDDWVDDTSLVFGAGTIPLPAGSTTKGANDSTSAPGMYRLKFVVSAGTGTIQVHVMTTTT